VFALSRRRMRASPRTRRAWVQNKVWTRKRRRGNRLTLCSSRRILSKSQAKLAASSVDKEFSELQLAFAKATNFDDVPPKEKHVQFLLRVCSEGGSQRDRAFVLETTARQVRKTVRWRTMLKTHVLLHRLLTESRGGEFKADFFRFLEFLSRKAYGPKDQTLFNIRYWKDDNPAADANELAGWTRTYASFLEELCALHEHVPQLLGEGKEASPLKECDFATLLKVMPLLQTLVRRITDCDPKSPFVQKNVIAQFALNMIAKDSFKVYRVMNEGVINLVDKYFDTTKQDASKGLAVFKRYLAQIDELQRFYASCEQCGALEQKDVKLEAPPPSFLKSMEEYYESAPSDGMPLRDRRLAGNAARLGGTSSTSTLTHEPLAVSIPTSTSQDLLSTSAAPSPSNIADQLSMLDVGASSSVSTDIFSQPSPTTQQPAGLPAPPAPVGMLGAPSSAYAAAPPPASNSSNALDFFSAPSAPAPSAGSQAPAARAANPFGENPFGAPAPKALDRDALDSLYSKAPPSPTGGHGVASMSTPQYVNNTFAQQPLGAGGRPTGGMPPNAGAPSMPNMHYPAQQGYGHPGMYHQQQQRPPQMGYAQPPAYGQQYHRPAYGQPTQQQMVHPAFQNHPPASGGGVAAPQPSAANAANGSLI